MPLVLVLETGAGLANGNAYASVSEAEAYFWGRLYVDDWIDSDEKEVALVHATKVIDANMDFDGYRGGTTQALAWPRAYVTNNEMFYGVASISLWRPYFSGSFFPSDKIPPRLKEATCELALALLKKDRTEDYEAKGISAVSLGQGAVSVDFDGSSSNRPAVFPDQVAVLLQPFGQLRYNRSTVKVRRV